MEFFRLFKKHKTKTTAIRRNKGEIYGKKYEDKIARRIRKNGIRVEERNRVIYSKNGKRITDIDIVTKYANIETKIGVHNTKLGQQLKKYKEYDKKREAIGMAPNLNDRERRNLNKDGFNVFSHDKKLISYLKYKSKNYGKIEIRPDPKNRINNKEK